MKYQVRIKDLMSDKPASELFDTYEEAVKKLDKVRDEMRRTWVTPGDAYIFIIPNRGRKI